MIGLGKFTENSPSGSMDSLYTCLTLKKRVYIDIFKYCETLHICGIKFSRFSENDILVYFNFGGHDIPWLQIVKKILGKFLKVFLIFSMKLDIVASHQNCLIEVILMGCHNVYFMDSK